LEQNRVGAVILAGGRAGEEMAAAAGTEHRALAPVLGRPIVQYVLDAVRASQTVCRAVTVTEPPVAAALGLAEGEWIPAGDGIVDNMILGVRALGDDIGHALICTADIPLVTAPMIDRFTGACLDLGVPVCYAIVARDAYVGQLADVRKTWVRMREGQFAGGNLSLISRQFVTENEALLRNAVELRKKPVALAAKLGFGVLLGVFLSRWLPVRVSIRTAEARASRVLGCQIRAVAVADAEIGVDVDKPGDLGFVERVLRGGAG